MAVALFACKRGDERGERSAPSPTDVSPAGASDPSTPLAKIGDRVITLGEFQERINRQSPYVRGRYTSLEHKKEFLSNMIRFEVLALEAKKRGLDKDADAINAMKQVMVQKLMRTQFESSMNPESIPESELRAYYTANQNIYNKPEEVRVAAIIMGGNKSRAEKVAKQAKAGDGNTDKGFRALVAKHSSDEESRRSGGDLRYFSRANKTIPKAVITAAFALGQTGAVAGPIKAGGKFYVIRQTGRRMPVTKSFEKVEPQIRDRLYRNKRRKAQRDFINGLKKATPIEIFEKRLKEVKIDRKAKAEGGEGGHGHGLPSDIPAMPGDDRQTKQPDNQLKPLTP